jgi:hypothetical protein
MAVMNIGFLKSKEFLHQLNNLYYNYEHLQENPCAMKMVSYLVFDIMYLSQLYCKQETHRICWFVPLSNIGRSFQHSRLICCLYIHFLLWRWEHLVSLKPCKILAILHNPEDICYVSIAVEILDFVWNYVAGICTAAVVVTVFIVLTVSLIWFVSVCRENDEEVGLGEVDERVSMLMIYLHVAQLPRPCM